jgi:histone H3/H4
MAELPIAVITRMIRNAGAERVSEDAGIALRDVLEAKADEIATKAIKLSKHAKRSTVKREDIGAAINEL